MTIRGVVAGGRLEVDVPADWPDGTAVEIQPVAADGRETTSAEEIERTLAAMDAVEPFEMTAAEEAAWQAARDERKAADKEWKL